MKRIFLIVFLLFGITGFQNIHAQAYQPGTLKNGIYGGDIKALDNVKEVNILYDNSEMVVGDRAVLGENNWVKEEEFLDKKTKAVEEKEGAGKGQEYREKWGQWMQIVMPKSFLSCLISGQKKLICPVSTMELHMITHSQLKP